MVSGGPRRRLVELPGPVDLSCTLRLHAMGPYDPTTTFDRARRTAWRSMQTDLGPATLVLCAEGPARVRAEAWGPGAEVALEASPGIAGAEDDAEAFAPPDDRVRRLARSVPGLRLPRTPDVLRTLVQTILQQRVTWRQAASSFKDLVHRFGEPAPGPFPRLRVFPDPKTLARIPSYELSALGVERRRGDVITRVAKSHRRIAELPGMDITAAAARLAAFPGVGPWTVDNVLGFALGYPDAAPTGDFGLPHLVTWFFTEEPRGDDERMLELLEPYRPHRWRVIRYLHEAKLDRPRRAPKQRLGPAPGRKGH